MATRSFIARRTDVAYEGVYCHWDGYPKHNGSILVRHYPDLESVENLLSHGDMSLLRESVGRKHDFNKPHDGWTVYYGRDRGETNAAIGEKSFASLLELMDYAKDVGCEFVYLFQDGQWHYAGRGAQFPWIDDDTDFSELRVLRSDLDGTNADMSEKEQKGTQAVIRQLQQQGYRIGRVS